MQAQELCEGRHTGDLACCQVMITMQKPPMDSQTWRVAFSNDKVTVCRGLKCCCAMSNRPEAINAILVKLHEGGQDMLHAVMKSKPTTYRSVAHHKLYCLWYRAVAGQLAGQLMGQ